MAHPASSYSANRKDINQNSLSLFSAADVTEVRRAKQEAYFRKSASMFLYLCYFYYHARTHLLNLDLIFFTMPAAHLSQ